MHLTLPPSSLLPQSSFSFSSPFSISVMKFMLQVFPRRFLRKKKSPSVSGSEPSFTSQTSSSSSTLSDDGFKKPTRGGGGSTPTSVLPAEWSKISPDGCFELKLAFEMIDGDGDGKIRKEEFEALLCRIGRSAPSQEELRLMVREMDRDGDGCITLEEFHSIGSAFAPPTCDAEMRETFNFFDADADGRITAEELFDAFKTIGDARCTLEDCRRMIRGVDRNGDGYVCLEDFSRMMHHQRLR